MYTRWADKHGFAVDVLDYLDGDEAGIKSVTFQVNGENAYGYLKSEKGVHRLVRISPFNAAGKRQTSFVSCDVMPDIEEDIDIEIRDEDLRIDTYPVSYTHLPKKQRKGEDYEKNKKHAGSPWNCLCTFRYHRMQQPKRKYIGNERKRKQYAERKQWYTGGKQYAERKQRYTGRKQHTEK